MPEPATRPAVMLMPRSSRVACPAPQQATVAAGLAVLILVMAFGIFIATLGMWGPRLV
jgi:hypothetical protein